MPTLLALLLATTLHEQVVRIPVGTVGESMTTAVLIEATVFKPGGSGPFPLVVINHGATGKADRSPRWRPIAQARWFVEQGFAVVVPMRRGNAGSQGEWSEGFGECDTADYFNAGLQTAHDILASVDFMKTLPFVDGSNVVLVGHSAGGFGSLAAASLRPDAFRAVLNFAGGRGSWTNDNGATRYNCSPAALIEAVRRFARSTRAPTLFLYSKNDAYFPPQLARDMFAAFEKESTSGRFVELPRFEPDGHAIFWSDFALSLWTGAVTEVVRSARTNDAAPRRRPRPSTDGTAAPRR